MSRRIWLAPNPASQDMLRMFDHPDQWATARDRITGYVFISWAIAHGRNPQAGPNNIDGLTNVIPGGAFSWLNEHGIDVVVEAGAVKEYSVSNPDACINETLDALGQVTASGGKVARIVMDEPLMRIVEAPPAGCGWTLAQGAQEIKRYQDAIHAVYPDIEIGVVEAYPEASPVAVAAFLRALGDAGCAAPFFHVDIDYYRVKREKLKLGRDLQVIRQAAHEANARFGAVVWGEHGTSNAAFCADASELAQAIHGAIGFSGQDDFVFQSWSKTPAGEFLYPDNLPESSAVSHTGLLLATLDRYGIVPVKEEP